MQLIETLLLVSFIKIEKIIEKVVNLLRCQLSRKNIFGKFSNHMLE